MLNSAPRVSWFAFCQRRCRHPDPGIFARVKLTQTQFFSWTRAYYWAPVRGALASRTTTQGGWRADGSYTCSIHMSSLAFLFLVPSSSVGSGGCPRLSTEKFGKGGLLSAMT